MSVCDNETLFIWKVCMTNFEWHISLLVENDEPIELFKIGHRLIGKNLFEFIIN